jgi:hypothetical protein
MIVNVRMELNDAERSQLACMIAGKAVKRLATRKEVSEFCHGALAAALDDDDEDRVIAGATDAEPEPVNLSLVPDEYADKPEAWKVSYISKRFGAKW